jgi:hypothetical protein
MEINNKTVSVSLNAVTQNVFPFRALETQKEWMQCCMQKPKELSIWKTVAAGRGLNNSLPLFPNSRELENHSCWRYLHGPLELSYKLGFN